MTAAAGPAHAKTSAQALRSSSSLAAFCASSERRIDSSAFQPERRTIGGEDAAQWSKLRSYASTIAPDSTVVRVSAPTVVTYGGTTSVGAVATSGGYERGDHIRSTRDPVLTSVTVVGPDLADADALSTAVFAAGLSPPAWWADVDPSYGLLTLSAGRRLRWLPPRAGTGVVWRAAWRRPDSMFGS